jgi:hypothetical protein
MLEVSEKAIGQMPAQKKTMGMRPQRGENFSHALQYLRDPSISLARGYEPRYFAVQRVVVLVQKYERVGVHQFPPVVDKVKSFQKSPQINNVSIFGFGTPVF